MVTAVAERNTAAVALAGEIERVLVMGDLSKLSADQRVAYYNRVCESVGLNPYTRPFDYLSLSGKLTLYAKKDATDQLRRLHGVSISDMRRERVDDLYVVEVETRDRDGRTDRSIGAVSIAGLKGDALANQMMKCETKAKRRATLSICGLGWLDETEIETVPEARRVVVDPETGEIAVRDRLATACRAAKARGWTDEDIKQAVQRRYDVARSADMTEEQMLDLADWLDRDGTDGPADAAMVGEAEVEAGA